MENMKFLAECEDCHKKFSVTRGILHNKQYEVKGQSITLTYYDCPDCGRRHFVQIDSNYTLDLLKGCKKQFVKLSVMRHKDKPISQKQQTKFKNARQHLADSRMNLMKKFDGVTIHDEESGDFILKFSVS